MTEAGDQPLVVCALDLVHQNEEITFQHIHSQMLSRLAEPDDLIDRSQLLLHNRIFCVAAPCRIIDGNKSGLESP
jgi:hypothetical protein